MSCVNSPPNLDDYMAEPCRITTVLSSEALANMRAIPERLVQPT